MVMNGITCEMMQDVLAEEAVNHYDPLTYLARYDGIPVIIDNSLPDNHVEVYEKWMYDAMLKYGKKE